MIGFKFGRLTVLEQSGEDKKGGKKYLCLCDCGEKRTVMGTNLRRGNSKSCGCARKESCSSRMSQLNLRHGKTKTKLWRTWKGVVDRTTNEKSSHFYRYGAKGISIFKEWLVFENFAEYMGDPPSADCSIDRINNEGGYFPGNVRWASKKEQSRNRSSNIYVIVEDEKLLLIDAAEKLKVSRSTASKWLAMGKLVRA